MEFAGEECFRRILCDGNENSKRLIVEVQGVGGEGVIGFGYDTPVE
jgi:hypothetical protein